MPNRLIHEKSPYLQQHAHNPVDWYPWGEEAIAKARAEDKPIFLSIGYSTCHWCHVMAHESFENREIADILNDLFVAVKVDREERPDIDRIYMTSLQAMGQNGGWPMSMFLAPDLRPFYGGTYFPPESRYGRAGFPDILRRIHHAWTHEREKVLESAGALGRFLEDAAAMPAGDHRLDATLADRCFQQIGATYDPVFGGFGAGPKFPRPVVFAFLNEFHHRTKNAQALEMVETTLQKMALGGMYDHLGGGFHRYSVDGEWRVPHFEKMLYDQAQLVRAYVDTALITGNPLFAAVASETIEYVLRDLRHPEGPFYSAEDADSGRPDAPGESGEGAFYVWTHREIEETLGADSAAFSSYYGIQEAGNVQVDPQHEFTGKNILFVSQTIVDASRSVGKSVEETRRALDHARRAMLLRRLARPRPHRDEKVLASWNGMMIGSLAYASAALRRPEWRTAAVQAAEFVFSRLVDAGTVHRRFRDGDVGIAGQLDDYAFLIHASLELFSVTSDLRWLERAVSLQETQQLLFWDDDRGGYHETPRGDPSVIVRLKEHYDGAEPTGNSIALENLLRLFGLTADRRWRDLAERTLRPFGALLIRQPVVLPNMVAALDTLIHPPVHVVIKGARGDEGTESLLRAFFEAYSPGKLVVVTGEGEESERLSRWVPYAGGLRKIDGKPAAYLCKDHACGMPTSDPAELAARLV